MRTYRFAFELNFDLIVPDQFVEGQLQAAQDDDATTFQKQLLAGLEAAGLDISTDAGKDEFTLRLLKNGLRYNLKHTVESLATESGLGARIAPVSAPVAEYYLPQPDGDDMNTD